MQRRPRRNARRQAERMHEARTAMEYRSSITHVDSPGDLLDPRLYADVRRPLLEASQLPAWCYTSSEFFARERDRIFAREWIMVGRAEDIPKSGDYFTTLLAGVPLVVVRGRSGQIRAFVNSCRHRGTEMVRGHGNRRVLTCPYHSWCYSLDGDLLSAPGMEGVDGFDKNEYPLVGIGFAEWEGFLFANLNPGHAPLDEHLGDLKRTLASHRMGDLVTVRKETYELQCNWKLLIENFKESYHLATVHRSTIDTYASVRVAGYVPETTRGEYLVSFASHDGSMALFKEDKGFPPIRTLDEKAANGSYFPLVYPHLGLCATIDCCWYLQVEPKDASHTRLTVGSLFPRETVERPDFADVVNNYFKRWDITIAEDNEICELQQRGLASNHPVRAGRYAPNEANVHAIDNWVLDRVLGDAGSIR
jgi:phenylpropionate dioxygenase-like ring-hydroxylating dioxygenase large terminal subunit